MKERLIDFNNRHHLFSRGDSIVIGVSGGADSVCLLRLLSEIKEEYELSLSVLHVHHGIRGGEADRDAAFVENMAGCLGLPFSLVKKDVPEVAERMGLTLEEAGRRIRYEAFEEYLKKTGGNRIALAHHQDDLAETVLFHLFRGSGPRGLAGIPVKRGAIIRPLLFAGREEIESWLKEKGYDYCEDSTNASREYTRNKIRHELLPFATREINNRAAEHIVRAAEKLADWQQYVEKEGQNAYERLVRRDGEKICLKVIPFHDTNSVLQGEVLRRIFEEMIPGAKDIGEIHYEMVQGLAEKESGKIISLPQGIFAVRNYEEIYFFRETEPKEEKEVYIECEVPSQHIVNRNGNYYHISIRVEERENLPVEIPQKDYTKWFDYDKINSSLLLRNPREGDFFVLDSEGRTKKLNRYFIDRKIPAGERAEQLVLADGAHVLWVIPDRISAEYKITKHTKRVLVVTKERIPR
ncbi:MAG: tRNA lysidine(34) synthetase TilS [Lachnospiraceae bacterium]|nr:tRNA lysidine(34) synthetase TilS [Lachnospiraceae bacterium]